MNENMCGGVRERIPDRAADRLDVAHASRVDDHVAGCAECRAELRLAELLLESRPAAPAALADRIVEAARRERAGRSRPWWGLTAAAVAALALGIGIASRPTVDDGVPAFAYEVDEGTFWSSEDGLLAGAPMLDELSDEALAQLLDELLVGSAGGAA